MCLCLQISGQNEQEKYMAKSKKKKQKNIQTPKSIKVKITAVSDCGNRGLHGNSGCCDHLVYRGRKQISQN